jgi:hypothetical protein
VWSFRISYKLRFFAWLVIYQRLQTKFHLTKGGFTNAQCPVCDKTESLKHILWECQIAGGCWQQVQMQVSLLLQGGIHWRAAVLGDSKQLVLSAFMELWNCF